MRVLGKTLKYRSGDEFNFVFIGDMHLGSASADVDLIEKVVQAACEEKAYVFLMGDYADALVPNHDERFDARVVDRSLLLPVEQYEEAYRLLEPLKGRILAVLAGNHDEVLAMRHYHDWCDELARKLEAPYGTMCTFFRLRFTYEGARRGVNVFDILLHHGYFAGRTKSGVLKRVQDMNEMFEADLYAMGHTHDKGFSTDTILTVDKGMEIREKKRYYVLSGSFLKSYGKDVPSGYAEKRMYKPSDLGAMGVVLKVVNEEDRDVIKVTPVDYR